MAKITVLTFARYYLPGFKAGGPIRTISNMVEALGDEFDFRIVCSDRDFMDGSAYRNVAPASWTRVGKAWVYYTPPLRWSMCRWMRLLRDTPHDIVYLNSLFDPRYTLSLLWANRMRGPKARRVVLAPRGEFSNGALGIKSWKKIPFLRTAKLLGLYQDLIWHASTPDEAADIQQRMGTSNHVVVARNFPTRNFLKTRPNVIQDPNDALRIVFLSRITRMKNLDYALDVLSHSTVKIQFDIWGTLEDRQYWQECQTLMRKMPAHVTVKYFGAAEHSMVANILSDYDMLFLPTRGENFGHVISEALSVGTAVLISNRTFWRNLNHAGVGWDLPLENGDVAFRMAIEEAWHKVKASRLEWRRTVLQFAETQFNDTSILEANRSVFRHAAHTPTKGS
ncbi:MAG: glycosyltransferase [Nitrospira sp.]|nr:glycosyltransferase [Nitrospira sp.]